jgi:hypothetical protein
MTAFRIGRHHFAADELADRDLRIEELEIALGVRPEPVPEVTEGEPWPPEGDLSSNDREF